MDFEKHVIDTLAEIKIVQEKMLIQTTKTNGRVDNLESDCKKHEQVLSNLLAESNTVKGRDKAIVSLAILVGTLIGFVISFLSLKN